MNEKRLETIRENIIAFSNYLDETRQLNKIPDEAWNYLIAIEKAVGGIWRQQRISKRKYKITMSVLYKPDFDVEAENMDDAREIADHLSMRKIEEVCFERGSFDILSTEVTEVAYEYLGVSGVSSHDQEKVKEYNRLLATIGKEGMLSAFEEWMDHEALCDVISKAKEKARKEVTNG